MSSLPKKVELLANIAIIIVAILLGVVLVNRYLLPASPEPNAAQAAVQIKPGMKLSFPDVNWEKSRKTLLLVLSTNCKYCTASAPTLIMVDNTGSIVESWIFAVTHIGGRLCFQKICAGCTEDYSRSSCSLAV
jgi:hypothetical protein